MTMVFISLRLVHRSTRFCPCLSQDFVFKPVVVGLNERFYLNKIAKLPSLWKKPDLLLWGGTSYFYLSEMEADIQVTCSSRAANCATPAINLNQLQ